jgi:deazaflavin-dependent oxidoreductase (nitroreductase family)
MSASDALSASGERVGAAKAAPRRAFEAVFRAVNSRVEPKVRKGLGSPGLVPAGLIVLETVGRRSGKAYRTPLAVTVGPGGCMWVSTVLGRRANWLRNAQAEPDVRYWLRGKRRDGRAIVAMPGEPLPSLRELPPLMRWATQRAMRFAVRVGMGMLVILPKDEG